MHIVGINFISVTAQNNALHMLGKTATFGILRGMAPLAPLNPPMLCDNTSSSYTAFSNGLFAVPGCVAII